MCLVYIVRCSTKWPNCGEFCGQFKVSQETWRSWEPRQGLFALGRLAICIASDFYNSYLEQNYLYIIKTLHYWVWPRL